MSGTILGINSAYHESAACLIKDGQIVAAAEEERFSRIKHAKKSLVNNAHQLPWQAIRFCLNEAKITGAEVGHIGYSLDPDARRRLNTNLAEAAHIKPGEFGTKEGEDLFYRSNLQARDQLLETFPTSNFHFIEHHICRAASAYTVSPFEEAAIIAVDGIGEFSSTWLGRGKAGKLSRFCRIPYPHSLGFLWEKLSLFLGFDLYGGPGKMMGYGCITDPTGELTGQDHLEMMREIVQLHSDGSFWIDNDITRFRTDDFTGLERRFGPRRLNPVDRYEDASIAAALQKVTEEAIINLAHGVYRMANERRSGAPIDKLCLAGGVALNCVANDRILRETPFSELWIQPASNDAGTALGAAAYIHSQRLNLGRPRMNNAFLGPAYDRNSVKQTLDQFGISVHPCTNVAKEVARRLEAGQLVAWFQGALEFGPRALGHRSILADPTRFDTRSRINQQVKMRESFRPFAPSVMAEAVDAFFDLPSGSHPADYMLLAPPLVERRLAQVIPAVVQENGSTGISTSRVHRVHPQVDPLYHELIDELRRYNGVGAVLNTSFNIREPIVATPDQAVLTFLRSGLDCLAIGPFIVEAPR